MSTKSIRLIITGLMVLVVVGVVGWYIWYMQNTGVLSVTTTDNKATVQVANSQAKQTTLSHNGKAEARLSPGVYTVLAVSGEKQTRSTVTIEKQQTVRESLQFENLRSTTTVLQANAQGIQGNGNNVRFLNVPVQKPYQYTPSFIDPLPYAADAWTLIASVSSMVWASDDQALVKNTYGDYFVLQNQQPTQLSQQSRANQNAAQPVVHSVAINAQNHVASNIGGDIFYQNGLTADLVPVANVGDNAAGVDISDNDTLVYYIKSGSEVAKSGDYRIHLVNVSSKSEAVIENTEPVRSIKWSADMKNLLYSTTSGIYLYNLGNKQKQVVFPNNSPALNYIAWAGNDQVIYIDSDSVWQYNINTRIAHRLAGYTGGAALLQDLTTSLDGKLLYYSIAPSNSGGVVGGVFSIPLN